MRIKAIQRRQSSLKLKHPQLIPLTSRFSGFSCYSYMVWQDIKKGSILRGKSSASPQKLRSSKAQESRGLVFFLPRSPFRSKKAAGRQTHNLPPAAFALFISFLFAARDKRFASPSGVYRPASCRHSSSSYRSRFTHSPPEQTPRSPGGHRPAFPGDSPASGTLLPASDPALLRPLPASDRGDSPASGALLPASGHALLRLRPAPGRAAAVTQDPSRSNPSPPARPPHEPSP